jgi:prepilin-type N-terminal cleavage/methylation domain-containing protein
MRHRIQRDADELDVERGHGRDDRGFTLVEVIICIVLMGVMVVPILSAVASGVRASARSRSAAQVATVIVNAADRVNRAPIQCSYAEFVQAAVVSQKWSAGTAGIVEEHYQPADDLSGPGTWLPGGCESNVVEPPELAVQRVTITITSPDGYVSHSIQVVKSDV